MRKLANGIYVYRGETIYKNDNGYIIGWCINSLDIYKTLEDARQAINKYLDGTNTKEPRVIHNVR